jgi:hypothetical protein
MSANKRIWTSQPQYPARLYRGHPFARRVISVASKISGGLYFDGNFPVGSPVGSGVSSSTGRLGQALAFNGSSDFITLPSAAYFANQNALTWIAVIKSGSNVGAFTMATTNNASGFSGAQFRLNSGGLSLVFGGTVEIMNITGAVAAGEECVIGVTYDGTTAYGFKNGVMIGSATSAQTFTHAQAVIGQRGNSSEFWNGSIYGLAFLSGADNNAAIALTANPWQLLAPRKRRLFAVAAGGAAALAGNAQDVASATGALTTAIPISAASVALATATASLTTAIPMAANAADVSLASGVLITSIRFSASALAVALASAGMTTAIPLAGSAVDQASASGTFTTSITLAGAAIDQVLATANLTALGNGLSAAAVASAAASGALTTAIPLAGNAAAYATAAGGLTTMIPLAGVAAAVSSATGSLTVQITFTAAALAQALAAGDLTTKIPLSAAALALASASGLLTGSGVAYPTPASRKLIVAAENRIRVIAAENRILTA